MVMLPPPAPPAAPVSAPASAVLPPAPPVLPPAPPVLPPAPPVPMLPPVLPPVPLLPPVAPPLPPVSVSPPVPPVLFDLLLLQACPSNSNPVKEAISAWLRDIVEPPGRGGWGRPPGWGRHWTPLP